MKISLETVVNHCSLEKEIEGIYEEATEREASLQAWVERLGEDAKAEARRFLKILSDRLDVVLGGLDDKVNSSMRFYDTASIRAACASAESEVTRALRDAYQQIFGGINE